MAKSRWDQIVTGMPLQEVQAIFGSDMWKAKGLAEGTWMINNEADPNSDHGWIITFDSHGRVKSKGSFSCA